MEYYACGCGAEQRRKVREDQEKNISLLIDTTVETEVEIIFLLIQPRRTVFLIEILKVGTL